MGRLTLEMTLLKQAGVGQKVNIHKNVTIHKNRLMYPDNLYQEISTNNNMLTPNACDKIKQKKKVIVLGKYQPISYK